MWSNFTDAEGPYRRLCSLYLNVLTHRLRGAFDEEWPSREEGEGHVSTVRL